MLSNSAQILGSKNSALNIGAKSAYWNLGGKFFFINSTKAGSPVFQRYQNHSDPKLGTEYSPQCMKIPNLASSYQEGRGRESSDCHVGWYWEDTKDSSEMKITTLQIMSCSFNS